ncbi:MAG: hypothetical protein R3212_07230, partial [Xanthomonadales bacterium]|nr:hypothetical protein [Xanthomonadales bacterium]
ERLARLLSSWPALLAEHDVAPETVDLRYTNGIAVHWRDPGKEQPGAEQDGSQELGIGLGVSG